MLRKMMMDKGKAIAWARNVIQDPSVCFLDTETTGLDEKSEIIDLAIVDIHGNSLLDILVKPKRAIPVQASQVHGLYIENLQDAPSWAEVYSSVWETIKDRKVVVYNANYDSGIVNQCCREDGLPEIAFDWDCAMLAYSDFAGVLNKWGKPKWHSLSRATAAFMIDPGTHRALADAQAARLLTIAMAESKV